MSYSYLDYKNAVNEGIHGKISSLIDIRAFLNRSVRKVNSILDLISTKRTSTLSPGLYQQVYSYAAPADLKDGCVVDIRRQYNRLEEFNLTTAEEFDRRKTYDKSSLAVDDRDGVKVLDIATDITTDELVLNECDSLTSNGTWVVGGNASGLSIDTRNTINGSASFRYDLASGGLTATLSTANMLPVDLTTFKNREIFVWQYIPLITGLTSFSFKWGSDVSNYWTSTVTSTTDGLAFKVGWNLLRFAWPTSSTGTPNIKNTIYLQLTINKTAPMDASTDWRTDLIVARAGDYHDVVYYTRYFWTTNLGVYIPDSTADTDILVADEDDFEVLVKCAMDTAGQPCRLEVLERKENKTDYTDVVENYRITKPSERKVLINTYHDFGSIDGDALPNPVRFTQDNNFNI